MADVNGNGKTKGKNAMGIGLAVSIAIAVMGWSLAGQSWAKDAGHETINVRLTSLENAMKDIATIKTDVARLLERTDTSNKK